jgi:hypothetical protein
MAKIIEVFGVSNECAVTIMVYESEVVLGSQLTGEAEHIFFGADIHGRLGQYESDMALPTVEDEAFQQCHSLFVYGEWIFLLLLAFWRSNCQTLVHYLLVWS